MYASDVSFPAPFAAAAERALPLLVALVFLLAPFANPTLLAQGLESEESIDAIVGSDVKTEQAAKEDELDRILAAIENTRQSAESVRKAFNLDALDIVLLPEGGSGTGEIDEAIAAHEEEIEVLRQSIQGSAMFYHAIDSRSILLQDVIAVEFGEDNTVTVFVNERPQ